LLGVSPAAFVGRKNCSKITSSQVLRSFLGALLSRGKAQTAENTPVFSRAGTKHRLKTARENRQWFESNKPKSGRVFASSRVAPQDVFSILSQQSVLLLLGRDFFF